MFPQSAADNWLSQGVACGRLHEIFAVEQEDAASAAGFAVALALCAQALPLLWLRTEDSERQTGRIHASGLSDLGLDANSLLFGLVTDAAALMRAAVDAARCPGLTMLVVEAWGRAPAIDLTATRRLMLAAERSSVTIMMLRVDASPVPSAAETRWGVRAAASNPLEADAPGVPCFEVELLRRRGGPAGQRRRVEWNRDQREFRETPLSGTSVPLATARTAASYPAAFVRHTK